MSKIDIINRIKDKILDKIENVENLDIQMELPKTNKILNGYIRGEFIVVSGRKTSGKSSFILKNYVMDLMQQKQIYKTDLGMKIMYFNTKKTYMSTIERMAAYYIASKSTSDLNKKISIASFYKYLGQSRNFPKSFIKTKMLNFIKYLSVYVEKDYIDVITGSYSIDEIVTIIKDSFSNYGLFNETDTKFEYKDDDSSFIPVIVIDDATMITGENGANCIRNENASRLAMELKKLARALKAIVVLNVPSTSMYKSFGKKDKMYINSVDEVNPYTSYADKIIFMHNPAETEDFHPIGYSLENFVNTTEGICYFRYLNVAANSLGASGVIIPYFFYPQSGFIEELPEAIDESKLQKYYNTINNLTNKEEE